MSATSRILLLVLWCVVSTAHAEDFAALPGITLPGVSFDTTEEAFASLYRNHMGNPIWRYAWEGQRVRG